MESYTEVSRGSDPADVLTQFPDFSHAAHLMVYCKWPGKLFGKYEYKAVAMVHMCGGGGAWQWYTCVEGAGGWNDVCYSLAITTV